MSSNCCDCCKKIKNVCCKKGLNAIKNTDKDKIKFSNSRNIKCSIDIDSCLKSVYPISSRWDYLICYDDKAIFIEVHPAENTSNIDEVIKKKEWLNIIIKSICKKILEKNFYWIASGRNRLRKSRGVHQKKLDRKGIKLVSYLSI